MWCSVPQQGRLVVGLEELQREILAGRNAFQMFHKTYFCTHLPPCKLFLHFGSVANMNNIQIHDSHSLLLISTSYAEILAAKFFNQM